jgi:hypothetical protein
MDKPINSLRLDQVSAFTASIGINTALFFEYSIGRAPLCTAERLSANQFDNSLYTVFVEIGNARRELVRMAAAFNDQRLFDQSEGKTATDPQPEIKVFTGGQRFIEESDKVEEPAVDNHGGRAHEASFQQQGKTVPARFAVIFSGIDAPAVPDPDFFGLAQENFGVIGKKLHLRAEFAGEPQIVRVEKRDPFTTGP